MISAVIYSSQAGSCKKYAEKIASELGIEAKPLGIGVVNSDQVIYVGWLMAGHIVGLNEARKYYKVAGVVQVGISPVTRTSEAEGRKANSVNYNTAFFCKQGAYDKTKIPGWQRVLMKPVTKKIEWDLLKKDKLNAQEQALYVMVTTGFGEPAGWNVDDVVAFAKNK